MSLKDHCINHWHEAATDYRARLADIVRKADLIFKGNRVDRDDVALVVSCLKEIKPAPLPFYKGDETREELTRQWPEIEAREPNYKAMMAEAEEKITSYLNVGA